MGWGRKGEWAILRRSGKSIFYRGRQGFVELMHLECVHPVRKGKKGA